MTKTISLATKLKNVAKEKAEYSNRDYFLIMITFYTNPNLAIYNIVLLTTTPSIDN